MNDDALVLPRFPDPRVFSDPAAAPAPLAGWYAEANESLQTSAALGHRDERLRRALADALATEPALVEDAITRAPSPFVARHLWRLVDEIWVRGSSDDALGMTAFALPVVVIAGAGPGLPGATLPGALAEVQAVHEVLRAGAALRSNQTFSVSPALVASSALAIRAWPAWERLRHLRQEAGPIDEAWFAPAPMQVAPGAESAHLRFLVGTAIAGPNVDLLADRSVARWGQALTKELARQLGVGNVSVLPLPRAPQRPLPARYDGWIAHREIGAQLFASNAIRKLRASTGEPSAVISSHRAPAAPGGGELRLSISSAFEPRDAEGFRCPIHGIETVATPLRMLLDLLRDCRVADVRLVGGVHPDTLGGAMPLFFKPDTVPEGALLQ